MNLADCPVKQRFYVATVGLSADEIGWIRAIGIEEGAMVEVQRRAPLGGPIHVRIGVEEAEFAIAKSLGARIEVGEAQPRQND